MSEDFAYELNGQRVAREQFYAVACDPRRSVAVEACAGAGKTWMLVSRMLRALLAGAQPHEILAITFTRKAAGEMRQRLQEWLEEFAAAPPEELPGELQARGVPAADAVALVAPLKALYGQLLAGGRPVQVRTFHSWFAALLRNAPLAVLGDLGLPASFDLLEDDQEAVQAVWRRFHQAVHGDAAARADYLDAVATHGRFNTQKALQAALAKRVEFALADARGVVDASIQPFAGQFPLLAGCEAVEQVLAQAIHRALLQDAARVLAGGAPTFAAKGAALEAALATGDMGGDLGGVLDALLTQAGEPRKFGKLAGSAVLRQAQDFALLLQHARAQHEAWLHQQRMARLTRLLIAEFAALKRERGWVDMNDVERAALVMLSDEVLSGWVQERLDARVRHLLIDEFQDTNPLQWQALHAWLSGYAGAGQAPSVFVVGDPKQSIYRFRRAEPQVFRAAQRFVVEALGGDLLSCDHTRRNAQRVIAVVNEAMLAAQDAGAYSDFRAHTTESAQEGGVACLPQIMRDTARAGADQQGAQGAQGAQWAKGDAATPVWRDSLTTPRELPEDTLRTLECRQAAHWLAAQIAAGRKPGDLMVLARKREPLSVLQDELRALHIAAQQPEKNDLADAPEVQDIVALVDVLVSPTHDLSLARALRSPLFGVDDESLVQLALRRRQAREQGRAASWLALLGEGAADGLAPVLAQAAGKLRTWRQWLADWPPHDALDAIYHDGDVLARYAQAAPAALRAGVLANLGALLGAALQVNGARFLTPYALVRSLRAGGARAPMVASQDAVRLLTVHGAKGLEAPLVLLLDTDALPPRAESMGVLVEWPGEASAPVRFSFLASETRPPACTAQALQVERAAREREELNALYVAMTRARTRLVLSSVQPHRPAPGSWWERLQALAEPLAAPPAQVHAASGAEAGTFALAELPPAPPPASPSAAVADTAQVEDEDSDASRLGQAMHRLLEWARPAHGRLADAQMRAAGREFGLTPGQTADAAAMAQRVLQGDGAWAWDPAAVDWQGNEVVLVHEGAVRRLDRLVRVRATGDWWVLDYKSALAPQRQEVLREQMAAYIRAVQAAEPGAVVRAAFLTSDGKLVKV